MQRESIAIFRICYEKHESRVMFHVDIADDALLCAIFKTAAQFDSGMPDILIKRSDNEFRTFNAEWQRLYADYYLDGMHYRLTMIESIYTSDYANKESNHA